MKYEIGVTGIDEAEGGVEPSTNLLVASPAGASKSEFVDSVVSEAVESDEPTIYVTTKYTASEILDRYGEPERFGVVDCVGQGGQDGEGHENVRKVDSPEDMTGIGIKLTDTLEELHDDGEPVRVVFDSVSTLLMYSNLETVFRFLHVLTGRIRSVDGMGVFFVDPAMHDDRDYSTLQQLFDGTVSFDDSGDRVRLEGVDEGKTDWVEL